MFLGALLSLTLCPVQDVGPISVQQVEPVETAEQAWEAIETGQLNRLPKRPWLALNAKGHVFGGRQWLYYSGMDSMGRIDPLRRGRSDEFFRVADYLAHTIGPDMPLRPPTENINLQVRDGRLLLIVHPDCPVRSLLRVLEVCTRESIVIWQFEFWLGRGRRMHYQLPIDRGIEHDRQQGARAQILVRPSEEEERANTTASTFEWQCLQVDRGMKTEVMKHFARWLQDRPRSSDLNLDASPSLPCHRLATLLVVLDQAGFSRISFTGAQ